MKICDSVLYKMHENISLRNAVCILNVPKLTP